MSKSATESHKHYPDYVLDDHARDMIMNQCLTYVRPDTSAITFGYQGDDWPEKLLDICASVDIVEGNEQFCDSARQRFSDRPVEVHHSLFEEFRSTKRYDTVIAGSVLECMDDPYRFVADLTALLRPGGVLILTTPNRRSLHRRIGCLMGLEPHTDVLNQRAHDMYVKRLYDIYETRHFVVAAGLEIKLCKGMFLKPMPSAQLAHLSKDFMEALMEIGDELGDYCKQIVVIAQRS